MKATPVFLSFLLFSICTNSVFSAAAEEPDAVVDIDGKKLRAGVEYYILPVMRGFGGGLTFSSFGSDYKLVYFPTVCDYCKVICKDVGIFIEEDQDEDKDKNERRRLALTDDDPFRVMFTEASSFNLKLNQNIFEMNGVGSSQLRVLSSSRS